MKPSSSESFWGAVVAIGMTTLLISAAKADDYLMEAPSFLSPCKVHDPNNGQCLAELMQTLFTNWKGDVPGKKAFPSIDPLKLKRIHVVQKDPLTLNLDIRHIIATGLGKATISNAKIQNDKDIKFTMTLPKFHINGQYTMKGRVLVLAIDGLGPVSIDIDDLVLSVSFKLKTIERNGERFFEPITLKTDIRGVGESQAEFENIFGEIQNELNDKGLFNDLFNGRSKPLRALLNTLVVETMNAFLFDRTKKIFSRIPARYIFTDLS